MGSLMPSRPAAKTIFRRPCDPSACRSHDSRRAFCAGCHCWLVQQCFYRCCASTRHCLASKQWHPALTKERTDLVTRMGQFDRQIEHALFLAPSIPEVYGVKDVEHLHDMQITIRGNPRALGDKVPRGFLQVVSTVAALIPKETSGRKQFADWIANRENPLTSRVTVNRIWQKFFGAGLVRTVDYFGVRGERPSHPELLDHLAATFMNGRWSQKRLIRSIVLSRIYRTSRQHNALANAADPDHRLLWRMNRRRLDAEALRDAMLAVSGQLKPSSGGSAIPLEFPENVANINPENVNPPPFQLAKWRPEQARQRTIYLPVIRSSGQPGRPNCGTFLISHSQRNSRDSAQSRPCPRRHCS